MKKILILHGWGGSNDPHWQYWLSKQLPNLGYDVLFPELTNKDYPNLLIWKEELEDILKNYKPNIVILHSLANTLWMHILNSSKINVDTLLMVAPPNPVLDIFELMCFNTTKIPNYFGAKKGLMVASDNDIYFTKDGVEKLAKKMNIPLHILENAGHINSDSGFGEWSWILEWIKNNG